MNPPITRLCSRNLSFFFFLVRLGWNPADAALSIHFNKSLNKQRAFVDWTRNINHSVIGVNMNFHTDTSGSNSEPWGTSFGETCSLNSLLLLTRSHKLKIKTCSSVLEWLIRIFFLLINVETFSCCFLSEPSDPHSSSLTLLIEAGSAGL